MQKMESLGKLTGGIAHDFNNLLMAVMGNLSLLKRRLPEDFGHMRLIDGALQGAERGAVLTQRLLAFARRQDLKPASVNIHSLVDGMAEMLRRSIGPTIRIQLDFGSELPPVRVDPNQLELALLNLALNARDAMSEGGRVDIAARREPFPAGVPGLGPGEYVCISVADTGAGMDAATLQRATEPFFTTKGVGKGTGLGLSMVHGLAVQSGGALQIASRIGEGTTVRLWLPVDRAAEARPALATDLHAGQAPPCRVLVVDDDPLVCASTVAMLEDAGHAVIEASSGQRALDVLRGGAKVDVIVTDQAMPEMTGLELARHIDQTWPGLPVILVSGYADLPATDDLTVTRLAKPFTQAALIECIAKAIQHPPASNVIPIEAVRRAK
jgi:CheY-like chemotaxis protein/two-component sensor histidine kinase